MMVDSYKYETLYYVHDVDEAFYHGEGFSTYEVAVEAAEEMALRRAQNYEITEVLSRTAAHVEVEVNVRKM